MRGNNGKIPNKELCCANCGQNHTANFHNCSARKNYINFKNNTRPNNSRNNINKTFAPAPQLQNFNFPFIQNTQNRMPAWQSNPNLQNLPKQQEPQKSFNSFQNSQNNKFTQNNHNYQNNQNSSFSRSHQNIISDLLSPEECLNAFNEFLSQLSICKNRYEQLQVIATITIKYLHK
jgi:hypothetical protein